MSPVDALLIFLLATGASLVQSLSGLGFGLMIVPPLVMVVGAKDAVVVSNVLGTLVSAGLLARTHGHVEWRTGAVLFLCSVVGMPVGLLVLIWIDSHYLQVVIAITVIVFTTLLARGVRMQGGGVAGDAVAGVLSGILRMSTSMSGPPVVIHLQGKGIAADRFRATISAYFLAGGLVGALMFALSGRIDGPILGEVAIGAPALLVGAIGGHRLYRHVDEGLFRKVVLSILFVSAIMALAAVAIG